MGCISPHHKKEVAANSADGTGDGILRPGADRHHGNHRADTDDDTQDRQDLTAVYLN